MVGIAQKMVIGAANRRKLNTGGNEPPLLSEAAGHQPTEVWSSQGKASPGFPPALLVERPRRPVRIKTCGVFRKRSREGANLIGGHVWMIPEIELIVTALWAGSGSGPSTNIR